MRQPHEVFADMVEAELREIDPSRPLPELKTGWRMPCRNTPGFHDGGTLCPGCYPELWQSYEPLVRVVEDHDTGDEQA